MALVQRQLGITFVLGEGTFGNTGSNQVVLPPLRASADIIYAGGVAMGTMDMAIFGMTLSQMNAISTLGMVYTQKRRNSVTVTAGDKTSGMGTVFQGQITNAWPDMGGSPDVPFRVSASATLLDALAPASVVSIKGTADAATVLSGLAVLMKLRFVNNNVNVKMINPYYSGSARNQALAITKDYGIEWNGGANGVLEIWNPGQNGTSSGPILISKENGMVQYPSYTSNGILVRNLFNPSISLGSLIKVQTDLKLYPADGQFVVYGLNHHLDAMVPHGRWFSDMQAAPPGSGTFTP